MLLLFDIADDAIIEHDHWHTHEHVPERLAIPGFLRGSRWIARTGAPRYFVMYEVQSLAVLVSRPYLDRLDNPTPWTAKMMRSYIGMRRALCDVITGVGSGMGGTALVIRFAVDGDRGSILRAWLTHEILPALVGRPGIVSAHLVGASVPAPMTREQEIRGRDADLHYAVLVTGYAPDAVAALADNELQQEHFAARGASMADHASGVYDHAFSLSAGEIGTG
ncbi:MAG TPA: hypothetical protein VLU54_05035 [Casimicrobiaceae bacterium]|nr:hypothetical protein [Casimicrobiaceae bacterium]